MVIDFHSHILPSIDDGSKDLDTSRVMLRRSSEQGIDLMVATPHFYTVKDKIDRFSEQRQEAYDRLMEELPERSPEIIPGAEVAFFRGISRAEHLDKLTIQGTDLLLLEMPFSAWSDSDISEVEWLTRNTKFRIMLAHLERYMAIPENRRGIERLIELPVIVQVNAGGLLEWKKRGKILKLLRRSEMCVLGSDCHGLHHRPPNLSEGRAIVEKKLGKDFLDRIDIEGSELLRNRRRD